MPSPTTAALLASLIVVSPSPEPALPPTEPLPAIPGPGICPPPAASCWALVRARTGEFVGWARIEAGTGQPVRLSRVPQRRARLPRTNLSALRLHQYVARAFPGCVLRQLRTAP